MLTPLRLTRLQLGLTQIGLGYLAKVPVPYISLYERGYPALKAEHKRKIASSLGVPIGDLFPEGLNE